MSYSIQQLGKTCATHTHKNPGLDNPFRLMFPICHSAFHCNVNQNRQTHPSITLAAAYPKSNEVHYKIRLQRSKATKSTSKIFCPSHGEHLLSSIITRPHTTRFSGACICHLIFVTFEKQSIHFFCSVYQKLYKLLCHFLDWS